MSSSIDVSSYSESSDDDDHHLSLEHRPLRASDFAATRSGTVVQMWYNSTNEGSFEWQHESVVHEHERGHTPRLRGRFRYDGHEWSEIGDYLYTFHNVVCCASSAEPCWASPDPPHSRIGWCHRYR